MSKRIANWSNLPKKYYYVVTNPVGQTSLILSETSFQAISIAENKDGFKYERSKYKTKKTK